MRKLGVLLGLLSLAVSAMAADPPTFSGQVVRIFQSQCQSCHHAGDIAPFSLMDYESTKAYAQKIKTRVMDHTMPPWKPAPGIGDFRGARILSDQEIETIRQWADAGAPEGNPKDLPPPLSFPDGWSLGQPDLVLSMDQFSVSPGNDVYRCFSLDPALTRDRYVSAVEVRAGNRSIVHHVLLFGDPAAESKKLDDQESGPGYTCYGDARISAPDDSFFGGWAPGVRASYLSGGTAMRLKAGSRIAMQVHYHPREAAATDQTRIGLYFTDGPVDKLYRVLFMINTTFVIPAGNPHYEVRGSLPFNIPVPFDVHIVTIAPHMHLLGREIRVQATLPDRSTVSLIYIPDWDFDWQAIYEFNVPVAIPALTRGEFTAYYDNSASNPRNPNSPPKDVRWGEQTTDEMAVVFFGYTLDSEHLTAPVMSASGLVNAASYAGGASAPGTIASLFGVGFGSHWGTAAALPLPRSLARTRVQVNDVDAPLFYASPTQVNFQVPFEVSTAQATVTLVREDGKTQSVQLPLAEAQPGIFTLTSDGVGPAAALRQNGTLVGAGNPAARGEVIALYATGLGRVTPAAASGAPPDGLSRTVNLVTVTIGGSKVDAEFAGLAPGFAGLYQVNVRVPSGVAPGAEAALKLTVAGIESNTVKLAVQ